MIFSIEAISRLGTWRNRRYVSQDFSMACFF
ncbi:MAG: hypothetical protein JWQ21_2171 [Herminiimonas sp.]|nr:hypothetical protein [Herminiimonas sp.]